MARSGLRTAGVGRRLDIHRGWTTGMVIAVGVLVLLLWNHPTPASVALVVGIVVPVPALLGVLAAASGTPAPKSPATGDVT